jgi:hypothetical protein
MEKTHDTCQTSGTYKPSCGDLEVPVERGQKFQKCKICNRDVQWMLIHVRDRTRP